LYLERLYPANEATITAIVEVAMETKKELNSHIITGYFVNTIEKLLREAFRGKIFGGKT